MLVPPRVVKVSFLPVQQDREQDPGAAVAGGAGDAVQAPLRRECYLENGPGHQAKSRGLGGPLLSAGSWAQGGVRVSWAWGPRGAAEKGRGTGQPKPFPLHMRGTRSSVTQLSPNASQPHGAEAG